MFSTIQLVTVLLVALAMVPAVAHALELPGKLRLAREQYLMVQRIYFPGFTFVGGIAETLSVFATLGLVLMLPRGTQQFHLALAGLAALILMRAIYWIVTQPANRFWLREQNSPEPPKSDSPDSSALTKADPLGDSSDWRFQRSRWEYSHVARAVLGYLAVALLVGSVIFAN